MRIAQIKRGLATQAPFPSNSHTYHNKRQVEDRLLFYLVSVQPSTKLPSNSNAVPAYYIESEIHSTEAMLGLTASTG